MTLNAAAKKIISVLIIMLAGLFPSGSLYSQTAAGPEPYKYAFLLGVVSGGMNLNTELKNINGLEPLDFIRGKTRQKLTLGVHRIFPLWGKQFESGFDFVDFWRSINYELPSQQRLGETDYRFQQIRVPILYRLPLYGNKQNNRSTTITLGLSFGFTIFRNIHQKGNMPAHQFKDADYGAALGLSLFPFQGNSLKNVGFFVDVYRGSKIFKDRFHDFSGVGNHRYIRFGLITRY